MAKKITSVIKYILHSDKTPIKGQWYEDEEIDSPKHQAPQDATSSDTKKQKMIVVSVIVQQVYRIL